MAKLIEITPEQYDALRELGVPCGWCSRGTYTAFKRQLAEALLKSIVSVPQWKSITVMSGIHDAVFVTIVDGE